MSASQWLEVFVSFGVQVSLVVGLACWIERYAVSVRTRSSVWTTAFVSILVLFGMSMLLPRLHLFKPWSIIRPNAMLSIAETQIVVGRVLLSVWCIGAVVVVLNWMRRGWMLQRFMKRCEVLPADEESRLRRLVDINDDTKILVGQDLDGPFCWQLHEPTIVLPRFLLHGSDEDIRHVLTHELEHLATAHPLQLFLQHAVEVLCWFHPFIWKASKRASLVREFACDDAAIAKGADTAAYLRTLLKIAERCEAKNVSLGFGRNRSEIVIRSQRLVKRATATDTSRFVFGRRPAIALTFFATFLISQIWLPMDVMASPNASWSPWPTWSARSLHSFGVHARDYEPYHQRVLLYDLREDAQEASR